MISIEDFDPLGHKDKMINTPRSLMACQELGIKPEELFLWNEEGFLKALGQEGIDNIDTGAAYQQYLEEMQLIFEKIRELREQIIEENDNGETGNFQGNNINVDMAQVEPEVDNTDDDDGEEHDQHHIKSKNLSKSRKLKKRTKKRPKTATNYGSQPSADMMNQFQKAQFLQSNKTKNRRSRLDDEDEDSPEPLPFNERSQKPSNSSKIHELELKEQRRQVNMLQSTTHADRKRERLMRKLLEGNLQARKAVLIKKGRRTSTSRLQKTKAAGADVQECRPRPSRQP